MYTLRLFWLACERQWAFKWGRKYLAGAHKSASNYLQERRGFHTVRKTLSNVQEFLNFAVIPWRPHFSFWFLSLADLWRKNLQKNNPWPLGSIFLAFHYRLCHLNLVRDTPGAPEFWISKIWNLLKDALQCVLASECYHNDVWRH